MAAYKAKTKLFIVLVDAHQATNRYRGANRGSGRWCVRAKDPRRAEEALASHIGKTHGSIKVYYEVEEGSKEYKDHEHLAVNGCEKIC